MAGTVDKSIDTHASAARLLPVEPGTIELRSDGSVTVAGHRVRLRQVVEAIEAGQGASPSALGEQFPTIDQALLGRVVLYVGKYPEAIARYMSEERDMERHYSSMGSHVSMEELRRLFEQAR